MKLIQSLAASTIGATLATVLPTVTDAENEFHSLSTTVTPTMAGSVSTTVVPTMAGSVSTTVAPNMAESVSRTVAPTMAPSVHNCDSYNSYSSSSYDPNGDDSCDSLTLTQAMTPSGMTPSEMTPTKAPAKTSDTTLDEFSRSLHEGDAFSNIFGDDNIICKISECTGLQTVWAPYFKLFGSSYKRLHHVIYILYGRLFSSSDQYKVPAMAGGLGTSLLRRSSVGFANKILRCDQVSWMGHVNNFCEKYNRILGSERKSRKQPPWVEFDGYERIKDNIAKFVVLGLFLEYMQGKFFCTRFKSIILNDMIDQLAKIEADDKSRKSQKKRLSRTSKLRKK